MSMNKYMHPRNIYKTPPEFKQLAIDYPIFRKYVQLDISGKAKFDFKNPEALRVLSQILLKKDFNLDVQFPENKLVPTIPLRLNYILWIEDLLKFMKRSGDINGIDIGTGASCVYPLLIVRKNNWKMLATEVDMESYGHAVKNVAQNGMQDQIKLVPVLGDKVLQDVINEQAQYDFCMCNPPFFANTQELHPFFKSRKLKRPFPKNAFVASVNEVVVEGGEVQFIRKIIEESKTLGTRIKVYTTMVGQKSNLPALKASLREVAVHSFKEAEFCQGNTTRWGLAWTFLDVDLRKSVDAAREAVKCTKKREPLLMELPDVNNPENVANVTQIFLQMFKELSMTIEEVSRNKLHQRFFVTAHSNTWNNQRKKRREKIRHSEESENNNTTVESSEEPKSPGKRALDDICESATKKLRLSTESESSDAPVYFKFLFSVNSISDKIVIELDDGNRETLHQILQYIKNNLDRVRSELRK